MFTTTPSKETKTEKRLKNLMKANRKYVEVGHFAESGEHSSGFSFSDLMKLHHNGTDTIPSRPVLEYLRINFLKVTEHPEVRRLMKQYSKSDMGRDELIRMLQGVGRVLAEEETEIFGNSPPLDINSKVTQERKGGVNLPLIETGELVQETSYRDSITKDRKKVF